MQLSSFVAVFVVEPRRGPETYRLAVPRSAARSVWPQRLVKEMVTAARSPAAKKAPLAGAESVTFASRPAVWPGARPGQPATPPSPFAPVGPVAPASPVAPEGPCSPA